jgi:hypothetical protein
MIGRLWIRIIIRLILLMTVMMNGIPICCRRKKILTIFEKSKGICRKWVISFFFLSCGVHLYSKGMQLFPFEDEYLIVGFFEEVQGL